MGSESLICGTACMVADPWPFGIPRGYQIVLLMYSGTLHRCLDLQHAAPIQIITILFLDTIARCSPHPQSCHISQSRLLHQDRTSQLCNRLCDKRAVLESCSPTATSSSRRSTVSPEVELPQPRDERDPMEVLTLRTRLQPQPTISTNAMHALRG